MRAAIEGKDLVITIPLKDAPYRASTSGKSLMIASTHGNTETEVRVLGRPVTISVNAYIPTS